MRSPHALAIAAIALFTVVAASARAQKTGTWNPALVESAVDPSALGTSPGGFFEYAVFDKDIDWVASGGFVAAGGVLRGGYGKGRGYHYYGLGYGRTLAQKEVMPFASLGVGVDLSAAYLASQWGLYSPRAARIAMPFSLRLGWRQWLSATPYVAPYAEAGRAEQFRGCDASGFCTPPISRVIDGTQATGIAAGIHVTAWRLGLELGTRDLLSQKRFWTADRFELGLRFHF